MTHHHRRMTNSNVSLGYLSGLERHRCRTDDGCTGHHLLGRADSHQADGIGRTRPGAAVRYPGAEAHCGTATGSARCHHRYLVVPGPQRHRRQRESRRVGQDCGRGARHPRGGMAELLRSNGNAGDASPAIPRQPQAGNLGEEMGGAAPVGWRPDLQNKVPYTGEPEARWRSGR